MNKPAAVALIVLWMLSGCNPYEGVYSVPSPTAAATSPAVTITQQPIAGDPDRSTPRPSCTVTTGIPAGYLNIRTGAGVEYGVVGQLQEGDELIILAHGAWLQVETPSHQTGWVNPKYCK